MEGGTGSAPSSSVLLPSEGGPGGTVPNVGLLGVGVAPVGK
jgi:hypothetical protein